MDVLHYPTSLTQRSGPLRDNAEEKIRRRTRTENMLIGQDPTQMPNSGGALQSALGKELSDDSPYAKTHAERTRGSDNSSGDQV